MIVFVQSAEAIVKRFGETEPRGLAAPYEQVHESIVQAGQFLQQATGQRVVIG